MEIKNGSYKNLDAVFMENEFIKLCVLPKLGGKIASIVYKPQDFEVLFQPSKDEYNMPKYGDDFSLYDTSGADEMFPSIDICDYPYEGYKGVKVPDHGELWSIPWNVKIDGDKLICYTQGVEFKYNFTREITLSGDKIHMEYKVNNIGDTPLYFLWAFHGLIACDKDTSIILNDVNEIINVHKSSVLGEIGKIHKFPITKDIYNKEYNIDKIQDVSVNKTEKFYVNGSLRCGEAALTLNHNKILYKLSFPIDKVPYLGVWINEGGFKREYNAALEPCTAFYDSLDIAKNNSKESFIQPNKAYSFYMDIQISNKCDINK